MNASENIYDVIIIGAGPAGLSAALVLGRCRRKLLLFDSGKPRNNKSHGIHGYLTRDGIKPAEFLRIGNEEIKKYKIQKIDSEIVNAFKSESHFKVTDEKNLTYQAKKILIATGISDNIPDIPGFDLMYGKSIFHCPYCDGWEVSDKRLGVLAKGKAAHDLSLSLITWSSNVTILTNGTTHLNEMDRNNLKKKGIEIYREKIHEFSGENEMLKEVVFENGKHIELDAVFFSLGHKANSKIAEQLGCKLGKRNTLIFDKKQKTNVDGVFVAGDACFEMKFVAVAAAEGAKAAIAINIELQKEELDFPL